MKIKTGDLVRVIAGADKGKTAKVLSVQPKENKLKLEGIGTRKRYVKPSTINPQGGAKDIHVGIDASKVALVHPGDAAKTTRVGHIVKKDGLKVRVATQAGKKEIK